MSDLGRAATARRLYLHVLSGGSLTPDDVSRMVQAIEELEAVRAARIEELESENARLNWERPTAAQMAEVLARAEAAEAKLARVMEALEAFEEFDKLPVAAKRPDVFEIKVRRKLLAAIRSLKSTNQT